jgi:hypothetical protein
MVLWFVLGQVIYIEGYFAQWYHNLTAATPDAFGQKLTGVNAAYFTSAASW